MATYRDVITADGVRLLKRARWCDRPLQRLKGFTFRRRLAPGEGLVLVEKRDGRTAASITMFFVFCDLAVIWVNDAGRVVDKALARPWRPAYVPQAPARYVIEAEPGLLAQVTVGQKIRFEEV